jgi:hypothetical protein
MPGCRTMQTPWTLERFTWGMQQAIKEASHPGPISPPKEPGPNAHTPNPLPFDLEPHIGAWGGGALEREPYHTFSARVVPSPLSTRGRQTYRILGLGTGYFHLNVCGSVGTQVSIMSQTRRENPVIPMACFSPN